MRCANCRRPVRLRRVRSHRHAAGESSTSGRSCGSREGRPAILVISRSARDGRASGPGFASVHARETEPGRTGSARASDLSRSGDRVGTDIVPGAHTRRMHSRRLWACRRHAPAEPAARVAGRRLGDRDEHRVCGPGAEDRGALAPAPTCFAASFRRPAGERPQAPAADLHGSRSGGVRSTARHDCGNRTASCRCGHCGGGPGVRPD
jgi:hypothetical protein